MASRSGRLAWGLYPAKATNPPASLRARKKTVILILMILGCSFKQGKPCDSERGADIHLVLPPCGAAAIERLPAQFATLT